MYQWAGCMLKTGQGACSKQTKGAPLHGGGDFAGVCQGLNHPLGGKDKAKREANGRQQHSDGEELALH